MTPPTSKRPKRPTAKRMGRPTKGATPAEKIRAVRFTEADLAAVDAIIADEQKHMRERGSMIAKLTFADVIRSLVQQEAQRRGLDFAAAS